VEDHAELAGSKGVYSSYKSPDTSSSPVFDPLQMRRALDNLLLNAIQNTPKGGQIGLEAAQRGGSLVLRVSDNGPGVSTELQTRLFEPFVTGRAEGIGLGLAIVREIAHLHGGDARLVTTECGATFEIEVPWRPY
jgi:signal transduction histidine kinase